jgi:type II secretory pathway component PulJ
MDVRLFAFDVVVIFHQMFKQLSRIWGGMPMSEIHRHSQQGFSLSEAMVGISILALSGASAGALFKNTFVAQQDMDRLAQVEVLRRTIREEFSCRASLQVSMTDPLPQTQACQEPMVRILGRDGVELFPAHVSDKFYKVGAWQIRARCEDQSVIFEGRMNSKDQTRSAADKQYGQWRELFGGTSRFCREYLSPELTTCGNSRYPMLTQFGASGPTCCRMVSAEGKGESVARCDRYEVLVQGGGFCASGQKVSREVPKMKMTGLAIGSTKPTKTTVAPPIVPHFIFPSADLVADIFSPMEKASVVRNGFLAKSLPRENGQGILNSWEAYCRSDDSLENFPSKAFAVCCPRGW